MSNGKQTTAFMDSSQHFKISCLILGNTWVLTSSHVIPAQKNMLAQEKHSEPDDHGSLPQLTDWFS